MTSKNRVSRLGKQVTNYKRITIRSLVFAGLAFTLIALVMILFNLLFGTSTTSAEELSDISLDLTTAEYYTVSETAMISETSAIYTSDRTSTSITKGTDIDI